VVVVTAVLAVGLVVAWVGQRAAVVAPARPGLVWALSPASNAVTIWLRPGNGPAGRRVLAGSHLTVSEGGSGHLGRQFAGGEMVRVPVPAGRQTSLLVQVRGPRPFRRTLNVTVPPALRSSRPAGARHGLRVWLSGPLRRAAQRPLCGTDTVSFPAASQVAVASSTGACRARLKLTARDGEQAMVPVTIPALPADPLYAFASPARRAIYLTIDDGWTPSRQVLALMRRTRLPVAAFLIAQAAQRDLPYWRAFAAAGGTIGDHTLSHPNLTTLTLGQATAQWAQARRALGRWLGYPPLLGRPPRRAFDPAVQAAAYRAGLRP